MPYSVSLTGNQPSARYGDDPGVWTQVRWEQASARSGPWTAVETQNLDDLGTLDTDPEHPRSWDLTTEQITSYPGWVRLVWLDAGGTQEPTGPVFVGSAIRPSVLEVATLMPDRTTLPHSVDGGVTEEAGTFTTQTRPTAAQVEALIDLELDAIDASIPDDASGQVQRAARAVVALRASILVEATYFSHQGEVSTARIEIWERMIDQYTAALNTAAEEGEATTAGGYGSVPITTPLSSYLACEGLGLLP